MNVLQTSIKKLKGYGEPIMLMQLPRFVSPSIFVLLLSAVIVLSGCAAQQPAPVEPIQTPADETPVVVESVPEVLKDTHFAKVISPFGPRKSGKNVRQHKGLDIKAAKGCAILAWDAGEVTVAGKRRGYGLSVDVRHQDGTITRYAHMSKLAVKKGEQVSSGQALGAIGRTGRATTNHLHFEVLKNGKAEDPAPHLLAGGLGRVISPEQLSRPATAQAKAGKSSSRTKKQL